MLEQLLQSYSNWFEWRLTKPLAKSHLRSYLLRKDSELN